jgi:YD repeat-containing protein
MHFRAIAQRCFARAVSFARLDEQHTRPVHQAAHENCMDTFSPNRRAKRGLVNALFCFAAMLLGVSAASAEFSIDCAGCTYTTTFGPPNQGSAAASCAGRADASPTNAGWSLGTSVFPRDLYWTCYTAAGTAGYGDISVKGSCPALPQAFLLAGPNLGGPITSARHQAFCIYDRDPPACPANKPACKPKKNAGRPCPGGNCTPHPIRLGTGNKMLSEVDYVSGNGLLKFVRYYNSDLSVGTFNLGRHWASTWDRAIFATAAQATVMREDGKQHVFNNVSGTWITDADVNAVLTRQTDSLGNVSGWTLKLPDDSAESYDKDGNLIAISDRAGLTVHLSYDTSQRLSSVSDPFGRSLAFTYDSLSRLSSLTDPDANTSTFAYDANQNLISVTYPDLTARTYMYESTVFPHGLTGIIDENAARYSTYAYDDFSHATASGLAGGVDQVNIAYNADGSQTVTDALGTSRTYVFDVVQGLVVTSTVSQPCEKCPGVTSKAQTFDANANVASRLDFNNNLACYTHDPVRNLETARVEGLSGSACPGVAIPGVTRTFTTEWNSTFRLPHRIAEPLRIITLVYDTHGNVLSKTIQPTTDADGAFGLSAAPNGTARTWTYAYTYSANVPGQVVRLVVDGPRTDVADITTYDWNASGDLIAVANALGHVTTLGNYDVHGRPQLITDANGLVTTLIYDVRGRLVSRNVGGELTSYTYDGAGQLTQLTMPDGSALAYTYDAAHRLIGIQDNLGNRIAYTLDAMGNRIQEQVSDGVTLTQRRAREYNAFNRLIKDIGGSNPATQITGYSYDAQGNVTGVTDPLGHLTSNFYDGLNRLALVLDPAASNGAGNGNTRYEYDGLDQLARVIDPRGITTSYTLDGLGNLRQTASPDTGVTASSFDAAGNVVFQLDARGVQTTFQYDALSRITQATYSAPPASGIAAFAVSYAYDQGAFGLGRLTGIADATGSIAYRYEAHGRLTQDARMVGAVSYVTGYSYDGSGRLTGISYPSGRTVTYNLDALGRVHDVQSAYQSLTQPVVNAVTYQPFGPMRSLMYGNAQHATRVFDLDGRLTRYALGSSQRVVNYDDVSRIVSFTDGAPGSSQSFGYDNLNRLTSWSTASSNQSFAYDVVGNRTAQVIGAGTFAYSYSPANNQLTRVDGPASSNVYQYDAAGATAATSQAQFSYDARHRLIRATLGAKSTGYQLNALGQRVMKVDSTTGNGTVYHYDSGGRLIAESDLQGNVQVEYIYLGNTPVAVIQ